MSGFLFARHGKAEYELHLPSSFQSLLRWVASLHLFTFITFSNHLITIATVWIFFLLFSNKQRMTMYHTGIPYGRNSGTLGQNRMDKAKKDEVHI